MRLPLVPPDGKRRLCRRSDLGPGGSSLSGISGGSSGSGGSSADAILPVATLEIVPDTPTVEAPRLYQKATIRSIVQKAATPPMA